MASLKIEITKADLVLLVMQESKVPEGVKEVFHIQSNVTDVVASSKEIIVIGQELL